MYLAQCFLVIVTAGVYFLRKLICWRSVPSSLLMWAHWSFCFNITAAALLTFILSPPPQNHTISTARTQTHTHTQPHWELMILHCVLHKLQLFEKPWNVLNQNMQLVWWCVIVCGRFKSLLSFSVAKKWVLDKGLSVWVQLLSPRLLS